MPLASKFCETVKSSLTLDTAYTQAGLLESLVSEANVSSAAFEQVESREAGKRKLVKVRYIQPIGSADVLTGVDSTPNFCGGVAAPYFETDFEANRWVAAKRTFSAYDLAGYCEGTNQVVGDAVKSMVRQVIKGIDARLITEFNTRRGNTSAGNTTPISARAFSDYANLVASPAIMDAIQGELFKLDVQNRPIIVGGQIAQQYTGAANIGCCNTSGQLISSLTGSSAFFLDTNMNATNLGAAPANNDWFVYPEGYVQFIDWSLSANDTVGFGDGVMVSSTQITVPIGEQLDFTLDLDVTYDSCDKVWTVTVSKYFGLLNIPSDLYPAGSDLNLVNYMLRFRPTTA